MRKPLPCLSHIFSATIKPSNAQPAIRKSLRKETHPRSGVECDVQPEGRVQAMQHISNSLFARPDQSLIVMLIKRGKI